MAPKKNIIPENTANIENVIVPDARHLASDFDLGRYPVNPETGAYDIDYFNAYWWPWWLQAEPLLKVAKLFCTEMSSIERINLLIALGNG